MDFVKDAAYDIHERVQMSMPLESFFKENLWE